MCRSYSSLLSLVSSLWVITLLTSCMVGPNFNSPNPPTTISYTGAKPPTKTISIPAAGKAGSAQHFVSGQDIPSEWWSLFHSPALNHLIQLGLANSPNLAAAKATLQQAQETLNAQTWSLLFPAGNAQLSGERQRFTGSSFGTSSASIFNLYNTSINISYALDVFGGSRRQIEAQQSQVLFEQFELEAAYLTLTANIVTTAITIASLQGQLEATTQLIRSQQDQLAIVKKQFYLGSVSNADVLSQESQLAQTKASLPPLSQRLAQSLHALSVLIGTLPNENTLPTLRLDQFNLPTHLPVSLPSSLVRQRPDIRASEAQLASANAEIGVATANLLPQITLNGNYGWSSTKIEKLFSSTNNVWSYGGQLLQPLFNFGALHAKRKAAIAGYEQAAAQYRQTVLQAFQNVADTLRAIENDAKALQAQQQAETSARRALAITQKQFRLGGVSYLNLLLAERQYQQARISRIQAQATRYTDTAALFQALGGGWWNRKYG